MANLKNIAELPVAESAEGLNLIVNDNGSAKQIPASAVGAQADFAVTDETSPAFIKNKPEVVQADWAVKDETNPAHLKNKPFYDTREYDNITLTFDGDMTGKEVIQNGESLYSVKLSDKVPSKEDLIGASVSMVQGSETMTIEVTSDMIQDYGNGNLIVVGAYLVVPDSFTEGTFTYSRGVWGMCEVQNDVAVFYTKELSWHSVVSGELKKIEEKYIPDNLFDSLLHGVNDTISAMEENIQNTIVNERYVARTVFGFCDNSDRKVTLTDNNGCVLTLGSQLYVRFTVDATTYGYGFRLPVYNSNNERLSEEYVIDDPVQYKLSKGFLAGHTYGFVLCKLDHIRYWLVVSDYCTT